MYSKLMTALVTPWVEKNEINLLILKSLINHLIRLNTSGILLTASTLDSRTLSVDDKHYLYDETIKIVNNRTAVYAGLQLNSGYKTFDFIKKVDTLKLDGYLLNVPLSSEHDIKGVIQFVQQLRQYTDKSLIINFKSKQVKSNTINRAIDQLIMKSCVNIKGFILTHPNYIALNKYKERICKKKLKLKLSTVDFYIGDDYILFDASSISRKQLIKSSSDIYSKSINTYNQLLKSGEHQKNNKLFDLYKQKFKELSEKCCKPNERDENNDEITITYEVGYIKYKTERDLSTIYQLAGILEGKDKEYYAPKKQEEIIKKWLATYGCKFEQEHGFVKIVNKSVNDARFNSINYVKETKLNKMLAGLHTVIKGEE